MSEISVALEPIISNINLPTVIKTTILPGDESERLFVATQVGEIYFLENGVVKTFLDIRNQVIKLGTSNGGYDERGLLGLAFHPNFYNNSLFYIHYSVAGSQGPGAIAESFSPNPCDSSTLNLKWLNRETQYDHIDTVEEWVLEPSGQPEKLRTLLNLRRPFANHNGVNSLNFSPETGKLILTTGDGGSGYDPFNLSQDLMEFAGKIIEIDIDKNIFIDNPPIVTRFDELDIYIQETLSVMASGVRNIVGITFQRFYNQYIKYVGNVGQNLVESIFDFVNYNPIPVTQIVRNNYIHLKTNENGLINLGWRAFEGSLPTTLINSCPNNYNLDEKTIVFYNEVLTTFLKRISPLTNYFHQDPRPDKFSGTALTGIQVYMGNGITNLRGNIVFTDFARKEETEKPVKGALAYTIPRRTCKSNDFRVVEVNYDFGNKDAYFVSLGTNQDQTRLFLGVYGSASVTDFNQGNVFEILPNN